MKTLCSPQPAVSWSCQHLSRLKSFQRNYGSITDDLLISKLRRISLYRTIGNHDMTMFIFACDQLLVKKTKRRMFSIVLLASFSSCALDNLKHVHWKISRLTAHKKNRYFRDLVIKRPVIRIYQTNAKCFLSLWGLLGFIYFC